MSPEQRRSRPPYLHCLSSSFPPPAPGRAADAAAAPQPAAASPPCEARPLLATAFPAARNTSCSPESDKPANRSDRSRSTVLAAHISTARPSIVRSITSAAILTTPTASRVAAPPSRPPVHRASTAAAAAATGLAELYLGEDTMADTRASTSFFGRATRVLSNQLELGDGTSFAHRNAPPAPSNWSDQPHRRYLVRLWDAVEEKAAASQFDWTLTQRVVSTEKSMLHTFHELAEGERPLSRDWIEYVLGVSLKHPFCTAEKMGRWEILASSGGPRGTWGPW